MQGELNKVPKWWSHLRDWAWRERTQHWQLFITLSRQNRIGDKSIFCFLYFFRLGWSHFAVHMALNLQQKSCLSFSGTHPARTWFFGLEFKSSNKGLELLILWIVGFLLIFLCFRKIIHKIELVLKESQYLTYIIKKNQHG